MNRELKSIFLLLIFLVLVVHEMIPHHHEHDADKRLKLSQGIETSIHSCENSDSEHTDCEIQHNELTDNNHECPHHYHNCTIEHLKYNSTSNSITVRQWQKSINNIYPQLNKASDFYLAYINYANSNIAFLLKEGYRLNAISLRAPPSIA